VEYNLSYKILVEMEFWNMERIKMKLLGKDGILYITLAIAIYLLMPLFIIIAIPIMWLYEKITGKEF